MAFEKKIITPYKADGDRHERDTIIITVSFGFARVPGYCEEILTNNGDQAREVPALLELV